MAGMGWTTRESLTARVRKLWSSGKVERETWQPCAFNIEGPSEKEYRHMPKKVDSWIQEWNAFRRKHKGVTLETRKFHGIDLPDRVKIDSYDDLLQLAGAAEVDKKVEKLLRRTELRVPELLPWAKKHRADLANSTHIWGRLLAVVEWFLDHPDREDLLMRQIPVPGTDTKFIEQHGDRIFDLCRTAGVAGLDDEGPLEQRLGLKSNPVLVTVNGLGNWAPLPGADVLAVPVSALPDPNVKNVFIVENATAMYAFPPVPDAVAIHAGGSAASTTLRELTWLGDKNVLYWGDLDLAGMGTLSQVRKRLPHVQSFLMGYELIEEYEALATADKTKLPDCSRLSPQERTTLRKLQKTGLSLEQEWVPYSEVEQAARLAVGEAVALAV